MSDVSPGTAPQTAHPVCSPVKLPDDFESSSQYRLDLLFRAPAEEEGNSAASEGGCEPSEAERLRCIFARKTPSPGGAAQGSRPGLVSLLRAMAILQVYQAKVLKDLHEGVPRLQELRSTTDYALRATKVTAQVLRRAMSTMVVQERHLCLNLAEIEHQPRQQPPPAPRRGRPPARAAQAPQQASPAARLAQQSSSHRKRVSSDNLPHQGDPLGKEQTLPCAEYLFSQCGTGLGRYDFKSFPRVCTVSAELRESTQIQNSGPPEILSEAPGAHDILSRGHVAGPDAHETATELASYLSPENGMAPRHIPCEHHTIVVQNLQPLGRHFVPAVRDASKKGWGAVCNGRVASGVWTGPHLLWYINCLELLTVLLALKRFRPLVQGKHVGLYRQHSDCGVHEPPGRCMLISHVTTGPPSPTLEPAQTQNSACHSHSGRSQSCGRFSITTDFALGREEAPPSDGPTDLESIRPGTKWLSLPIHMVRSSSCLHPPPAPEHPADQPITA
ncbi:rRNA biogenesis protein rrp36 [Labeo rohita]|uniref:rRNA biogenesis protein rrp36 n=1 Tax=Labeo rohita TaxID=84645 RepID=A0ABQ8LEI7_LABRO|nr:rRNA biogenesis protein rrp36 [Labeo rohita]